jgi:hypothetical protein
MSVVRQRVSREPFPVITLIAVRKLNQLLRVRGCKRADSPIWQAPSAGRRVISALNWGPAAGRTGAIGRAFVAAGLRPGAPRDDGSALPRSCCRAHAASGAVRGESQGAGCRDRRARGAQRCVLSCGLQERRRELSLKKRSERWLGTLEEPNDDGRDNNIALRSHSAVRSRSQTRFVISRLCFAQGRTDKLRASRRQLPEALLR